MVGIKCSQFIKDCTFSPPWAEGLNCPTVCRKRKVEKLKKYPLPSFRMYDILLQVNIVYPFILLILQRLPSLSPNTERVCTCAYESVTDSIYKSWQTIACIFWLIILLPNVYSQPQTICSRDHSKCNLMWRGKKKQQMHSFDVKFIFLLGP